MDHMWTWGGTYFGYRRDDLLFTHNGDCAGRISGDEIFGRNGQYLGEIKNDNRLITHRSKFSRRGTPAPNVRGGSYARYANYAGYAMYAGYEDFPAAERAAVAGQLFGEEGSIAISRIDTATLRQATQDVRDFGVVVSEQDADQIERTNDAISRLGLIWRGLSNQLAVAAAPAL